MPGPFIKAKARPAHFEKGKHVLSGSIVRLISDRGFGFIKAADSAQEFFFHRTALGRTDFAELYVGQVVRFGAEPSDRGPRARDVQVVDA